MTLGALLVAAAIASATPVSSGPKTDIVYMKNGDRMTCEIKALDSGALQVSLDYVDGTISIEWSKILRIESSKLFIVRLTDGAVYTGTLTVVREAGDSNPAAIEVAEESGDTVAVSKRDVVRVDQTSDAFWHRFFVDVNSGVIYSKGNQTTQYNFSSTVGYPRERWGVKGSFNSSLSSSSGRDAATRNQFNLSGYKLAHWKNWFYSATGAFLQSTEQSISLQSNLGGGMGYFFRNNNRLVLSVLGGLAYQNTQYESGSDADAQNVLAGMISANLKVFTFSKTDIALTANLLPALSEPGRFFFNTNASYYFKLWSNLTLNFSFYGNWDTRPPTGLSGSDYGLSSGLGWSFGNQVPGPQ